MHHGPLTRGFAIAATARAPALVSFKNDAVTCFYLVASRANDLFHIRPWKGMLDKNSHFMPTHDYRLTAVFFMTGPLAAL